MTNQKRTERVVIRLTPDEKQTLDALSGGNGRQHARDLILQESNADDQVLRHLHALGRTLNEALSVLIEESEGQMTSQLSALRDAIKELQRQTLLETSVSIQEILQQIHDAVGGDKLV